MYLCVSGKSLKKLISKNVGLGFDKEPVGSIRFYEMPEPRKTPLPPMPVFQRLHVRVHVYTLTIQFNSILNLFCINTSWVLSNHGGIIENTSMQ
jgi:hypothetical protein